MSILLYGIRVECDSSGESGFESQFRKGGIGGEVTVAFMRENKVWHVCRNVDALCPASSTSFLEYNFATSCWLENAHTDVDRLGAGLLN